jgi:hypothetical protein
VLDDVPLELPVALPDRGFAFAPLFTNLLEFADLCTPEEGGGVGFLLVMLLPYREKMLESYKTVASKTFNLH